MNFPTLAVPLVDSTSIVDDGGSRMTLSHLQRGDCASATGLKYPAAIGRGIPGYIRWVQPVVNSANGMRTAFHIMTTSDVMARPEPVEG